ncbi:MAG: STAS domain-containing protein [Gammaproteobacteria bacterium]|nr:STAS domain-containing protein [Gammaproteobacteria bacterium]
MDALTIKLPAELEISEVTQCHSDILKQLTDCDPQQEIKIDASDLWRIDTAGIQLLVSLVDEASSQNKSITWHDITDELKECATRLGLFDVLNYAAPQN